MMNQFTVSSSPHITARKTTHTVMRDVLISLAPASIAAIVIFGWYSLALITVCIAAAVLSEFLFNIVCKKEQTICDLSAAVTGLILALNLPTSVALWQAAIGSVVAIVVVKCLFGGIGQNFANPAIVARIVLFLSFSDSMAKNPTPTFTLVDSVSGATPLAVLSGLEGELPSMTQLIFGLYGGAIGETCSIALIIGLIYLLCRKVITWHIPITFIATVAILTLGANPIYQVLSGGLLIGAIFMATDYVTSPATPWGKVIFGIGCGLITVLIRVFGNYPEGVSFGILLMNILTPYIEKWTVRRPLGSFSAKKNVKKEGEAK
ncbi:MAG: RnfABCDGE type electron transport complex subunit D [Ruminococcaceae bacterium]|nr:RnfABCDGE type electron transport complex subunit D [Oscillospiraceae bacterium]